MLSLTHFVVEFKTKFMTLGTNFKIRAWSTNNLTKLDGLAYTIRKHLFAPRIYKSYFSVRYALHQLELPFEA